MQQAEADDDVRVLLLSPAAEPPPLLYSVLGLKFTGRAVLAAAPSATKPRLLVATPRLQYDFTDQPLSTLGLLLRMLQPEPNDVFVAVGALLNLVAVWELSVARGGPLSRLGAWLCCALQYNCTLLLLWLPAMWLSQCAYVRAGLKFALRGLRAAACTHLAQRLRLDLQRHHLASYQSWMLSLLWLMAAIVVSGLIIRFVAAAAPTDADSCLFRLIRGPEQERHAPSWRPRLMDIFFRQPRAQPHPDTPSDAELGDVTPHYTSLIAVVAGLWLESMALPSLWLQPSLLGNMDYIKALPVWIHATDPVPPDLRVDGDCVICLEQYRSGERMCGLGCGHVFHHSCIMGWLTRDNHHCPVCRFPCLGSGGNKEE